MSDLNREASPEAERLQSALIRLEAGDTWEEVSAVFVGADEELALAALAFQTSQVCGTKAPASMRARQQVELQSAFERQRSEARRRVWGRDKGRSEAGGGSSRSRLILVRFASGLLALALATGSAVVASANSLPGEVLYPVKLAAEGARVALSGSTAARAALRLELAGVRLNEIRRLVDLGIMPSPQLIDAMLEYLTLSERDAEASDDPSLLAFALTEIDRHTLALRELAERMDPTTRGMIESALGGVADQPDGSEEEPPSAWTGFEPTLSESKAPVAIASYTPDASAPGGAGFFVATPLASPSAYPSASPTPTLAATSTPIGTPPGGSGGSGRSTPLPPPTDVPGAPTDEPADTPIPDNPRATERAREEPTPPPKVTPRGRPLPGEPHPPIGRPPGRP